MIEPLVCIVPAYNADASVEAVVKGIKLHLPRALVLGVDDGSTDATRSILQRTCDQVILFDVNQGKGVALRESFQWAVDNGARGVLQIDADGQHDPSVAPAIVAALDKYDIVIGTREISGKAVPIHRRFANMLSTSITRAISKCPVQDSQSGYRAIRIDVLKKIKPQGTRYEFETDFIILAGNAGFTFGSVPIPVIYDSPTPSNFRPLHSSFQIAKVLWRHKSLIFR
ncbi:MAG: glycosyltransferase family 2 protein [Gemmatimonadaceae bacterium]|nr:glycosyltransferase family 2 protein [Gemmatimonadaceae bacterium]